jgi:hypothetical protein
MRPDTTECDAWMATGPSRETSPEIMEAIWFLARTPAEAETLWEGDGFGRIANLSDIVERVTRNGRLDARDFVWGGAGSAWAEEIC